MQILRFMALSIFSLFLILALGWHRLFWPLRVILECGTGLFVQALLLGLIPRVEHLQKHFSF